MQSVKHRGPYRMSPPGICTKCRLAPKAAGQRWCKDCRNAWSRENRKKHFELSPEERQKSSSRAYANVYQGRGKLKPMPCETCGTEEGVQKHHDDYSKPLQVIWLCGPCRRKRHETNRRRK